MINFLTFFGSMRAPNSYSTALCSRSSHSLTSSCSSVFFLLFGWKPSTYFHIPLRLFTRILFPSFSPSTLPSICLPPSRSSDRSCFQPGAALCSRCLLCRLAPPPSNWLFRMILRRWDRKPAKLHPHCGSKWEWLCGSVMCQLCPTLAPW